MHKSKSPIHEIKVIILTFTVYCIQKKFAVLFPPVAEESHSIPRQKDNISPSSTGEDSMISEAAFWMFWEK